MGTSRSAAQFASKIAQAGKNLEQSQKTMVADGALVMKRYLLGAAVAAAGGDRKLSNLPIPLNVGFDVKGTNRPGALFKARGPWGLTEYGASPHFITSRHGGGSRASRSRRLGGVSSGRNRRSEVAFGPGLGRGGRASGAVRVPKASRGWAAYARHPGTKGKGTWARAKAAGARPATSAMRAPATRAVLKAF